MHLFLLVLNELEGLARGGRDRDRNHLSRTEQEHVADVSESARAALAYLRSPVRSLPTIRCVTTRGKFINSFTTFVVEDDIDRVGFFNFHTFFNVNKATRSESLFLRFFTVGSQE